MKAKLFCLAILMAPLMVHADGVVKAKHVPAAKGSCQSFDSEAAQQDQTSSVSKQNATPESAS